MLLSDVVGVLLKAYPLMMPALMAYQASIIKCCCNFDRLAWAQNNCTHLVQTKDLQWSRPPQLLFCSEETCCRQILLLSDNHLLDQCPDNPARVYLPWQ